VTAERAEQPERIFGILAVHGECAVGKCNEPTVAAAPMQILDETGVLWLCEQHADVLPWFEGIRSRHGPPRVFNLSPTCHVTSLGPDHSTCGGAADYVALIGRRYVEGALHFETASVCERHARELPIY
jgi:hypothetical protein